MRSFSAFVSSLALVWPLVLLWPLAGCTTLHHVQLDEIDSSRGHLTPFSVRVSEIGINTREVGQLASAVTHNKSASKAAAIMALFQFGPKTGEPGLDDRYADVVAQAILDKCPSGRVTGLVSLRETTKVYAISGEYVTVRGFCIVD
jgi:hypothetical protein